jgi:hypothetical protein
MHPCRPVFQPAMRRHGLAAAVALALAAASAAAPAQDIVTLWELPQGEFEPAHPSSIARDGTVVGVSFNAANDVVRWRPGQAPESLGGGPGYSVINVTPVMNTDGTVIVTPFMDWDVKPVASIPRAWRPGEGWQDLGGLVLGTSIPMGISADGSRVTGFGRVSDADWYDQPWVWDATSGQQVLPVPDAMDGGEAWAASDDGHIVAGHAYDRETDDWGWPVTWRYGARWVDGAFEALTDGEGRALGQVVACNADCSILVGGGAGGNEPPHEHASHAWYWSEATGGVYLDPSPLPADALPPYYAMDVTDDGSTIIGTYTVHVEDEFGTIPVNKPFIWRADTGMRSLAELMAEHGIAFGGEGWEMVPNDITPDGTRIVLNGMDPDYRVRSGVLTMLGETIFADGFE